MNFNEFTVTVCDTGAPGWVWKNPYNIQGPGVAGNFDAGSGQHATARSHGTDGSVEVIGNSKGENTVSFDITRDSDGARAHVILHIIVIDCSRPKAGLQFNFGFEIGGHHDDSEDRPRHDDHQPKGPQFSWP